MRLLSATHLSYAQLTIDGVGGSSREHGNELWHQSVARRLIFVLPLSVPSEVVGHFEQRLGCPLVDEKAHYRYFAPTRRGDAPNSLLCFNATNAPRRQAEGQTTASPSILAGLEKERLTCSLRPHRSAATLPSPWPRFARADIDRARLDCTCGCSPLKPPYL